MKNLARTDTLAVLLAEMQGLWALLPGVEEHSADRPRPRRVGQAVRPEADRADAALRH